MISLKSALAFVLVLATTAKVSAFDALRCTTFVFRTSDNYVWSCGDFLPEEPGTGHRYYCDHSLGDAINPVAHEPAYYADKWCYFMVDTIRSANATTTAGENHYSLTLPVGINETPGPWPLEFNTINDWGCYVVENGIVTESYIVDSREGGSAVSTTEQCDRTPEDQNNPQNTYFDYDKISWWNWPDWGLTPSDFTGAIPPTGYTPAKGQWNQCHYSKWHLGLNYVPELDVTHAECLPGYVCEEKWTDYALCMPDMMADHECCISWAMRCEGVGECCAGSECDEYGYCNEREPQVFTDPPGICGEGGSKQAKEDKNLYSRCYQYDNGQGDCADGYLCVGHATLGGWFFSTCEMDPSVENECCLWNYDSNYPRPGDCCVGWYAHCNSRDPNGKCQSSICMPGRETGDINGVSMKDVHDGICSSPPVQSSFNENIGKCVGAVCGVWGDPHIITCDDLHYDCQALGIFTLMKNHMFNIQGNFIFMDAPWGAASVTNDLAIDFIKGQDDGVSNGVPTFQFSFPNFENIDENNQIYDPKSRVVGACPLMMYVDGEMRDISQVQDNGFLYGGEDSDHSVQLVSYNEIHIQHKVGEDIDGNPYYSESKIWIDGGGPFTEWSCIITFFICLPQDEQEMFETSSSGLLGTPTNDIKDDWMGKDGQTLMLPDHNRNGAAWDYCTENWCVEQEESIITYEDGSSYSDYKCNNTAFTPFDVYTCEDPQSIIEKCKDTLQPVACQMETCIGNPDVIPEIEVIGNLTELDTPDTPNFLEFPETNTTDEYGDCTDLGAGLSGATGTGAWSSAYPQIDSIFSGNGGYSLGHDNSISVLVGGNFNCKQGSGIEGRSVFLGDMTISAEGCKRLAATATGSLIHPFENTPCVEVGGAVSIDSGHHENTKYIMYEYGNAAKSCHFVYKEECTLNGASCPTNMTELALNGIKTNGDFVQNSELDLAFWEEEMTLLQQKTNYWTSLEANGVAEIADGVLSFSSGSDNNPVQIFDIEPIATDIHTVVFRKNMNGKTILIRVDDSGEFLIPTMCFTPDDALPGEAPICGSDSFPSKLTGSIAWLFTTSSSVEIVGAAEMHGSIVVPFGSMTFSSMGHSGRFIVKGDLTIDGEFTELHNYEFDPVAKHLPLGSDLDLICSIAPPVVCNETYKTYTSETACPSKPEGVVKLIKSSAEKPEDEPILYDIFFDPPSDINSARTVKFKVDNPFTNHTDIYIKHVKKVGKYAMDPVCEAMPFTAGCAEEAPEIEVGCHEYEGVDAFALVNIYFASNTDSMVMDIGADGDVTIDKCCKPPEEYQAGYGFIEYTFEIQCTCPDGIAQA